MCLRIAALIVLGCVAGGLAVQVMSRRRLVCVIIRRSGSAGTGSGFIGCPIPVVIYFVILPGSLEITTRQTSNVALKLRFEIFDMRQYRNLCVYFIRQKTTKYEQEYYQVEFLHVNFSLCAYQVRCSPNPCSR